MATTEVVDRSFEDDDAAAVAAAGGSDATDATDAVVGDGPGRGSGAISSAPVVAVETTDAPIPREDGLTAGSAAGEAAAQQQQQQQEQQVSTHAASPDASAVVGTGEEDVVDSAGSVVGRAGAGDSQQHVTAAHFDSKHPVMDASFTVFAATSSATSAASASTSTLPSIAAAATVAAAAAAAASDAATATATAAAAAATPAAAASPGLLRSFFVFLYYVLLFIPFRGYEILRFTTATLTLTMDLFSLLVLLVAALGVGGLFLRFRVLNKYSRLPPVSHPPTVRVKPGFASFDLHPDAALDSDDDGLLG
ncbi:hypothetical protein HK405_011065, partial [Cladochytrium tenue]